MRRETVLAPIINAPRFLQYTFETGRISPFRAGRFPGENLVVGTVLFARMFPYCIKIAQP